jgi:hypothetical protein
MSTEQMRNDKLAVHDETLKGVARTELECNYKENARLVTIKSFNSGYPLLL